MGALEEVTRLKNQQVPEDEIIYQLQQEGFSPKEINDALNQSEIKSAVSQEDNFQGQYAEQDGNELYTPPNQEDAFPEAIEDTAKEPSFENRQPSQDNPDTQQTQTTSQQQPTQNTNYPNYNTYQPQPQFQAQPQAYQQQYQQDYNQDYSQKTYSSTGAGYDANTMVEISEQVFELKSKEIKKETEGFNEFKTLIQTQVEDLSQRLKRMETMIDKLQITILEKVGSYGNNIQNIKKEMSMMQDSFGKMVNPILNTTKKKQTRTKKKTK